MSRERLDLGWIDRDRALRNASPDDVRRKMLMSPRMMPAVGGGGVSFMANRPSGMTLINDHNLNTIPDIGSGPDANGWIEESPGGADGFAIETDSSAPFPSHSVLRTDIQQGAVGGSSTGREDLNFSVGQRYHNLYISAVVALSNPFSMSGNIGMKWIWPCTDSVQGGNTYTGFHNFGTDDLEFCGFLQGPGATQLDANLGNSALAKFGNFLGQYREVEMYLRAASGSGASTPDGEFHCWIGGVKTHTYTNVPWNHDANRVWYTVKNENTYGGGVQPAAFNMNIKLNRLVIYGSDT